MKIVLLHQCVFHLFGMDLFSEAQKTSNAGEAAGMRPADDWERAFDVDILDSDDEDDPWLADKQAKKRPVRRKKKKAVAGDGDS